MRLLLLLASAAAISKVPKAPTAGRAAAISSKTPQKPTTGRAAAKAQAEQAKPLALSGGGANKQVSYAWAVLHNWLYFLSLGLCIPVLPKVIASTVNDDGAAVITSKSARVAGDVEGVDKLLTFLFVGALGGKKHRDQKGKWVAVIQGDTGLWVERMELRVNALFERDRRIPRTFALLPSAAQRT